MNRRGLGRGRLLVGAGAVITLGATALPWYTAGGQLGLPLIQGLGVDGAGIVVFVATIVMLAVLALPYASRDGRSSLDRPMTFIVVAGAAVAGFLIRLVQLWSDGLLALPDRSAGLWLAGAGLLVVAWGVAEILAEPAPPL